MQENNWPPLPLDTGGLIIPGHSAFSLGKRLWRKGKWTDEEEKYTKKLISLFNQGLLPLSAGTTLRCFLSEKLNWYYELQLFINFNKLILIFYL